MRILVVDDHQIVRRGVCGLLEREKSFEICGEAADGREAIIKARALRPDAIVMDMSMPVMNRLEATREITLVLPQIRIVVLSQHDSPEMMREALNAGAHGYVIKSEASTHLVEALYQASQAARPEHPAESAPGEKRPTVEEILERSKGFEQALRDSEERLRGLSEYQAAVMSSLAEGLYTVDANGILTFINPAAESFLGWTKEELLGKKMHDATHYKYPDGTPFPAEHCPGLHVLRTGTPLREHQDVFIRKDGHFLPVVFSASPLNSNGIIAGLVIAFRDDTERRRSREAILRAHHELETATAHLQLVTETMAVGVTRCSADLRYLWANASYAAWLQRSPDEIVGRPIVDVLGQQAFQKLLPHFQAVLEGKEVKYEEEVDFAGIGPRWISAVYTPTKNSNGVTDGWVAVVRDITARKAGQENARRDKELLEVEASALARLNEMSSRLPLVTELSEGLDEVLAGAIDLMGAAMGTFQLLDVDLGILRIAAQRGFQNDFLDFFREVSLHDDCACGRALRLRTHVMIADVDNDPGFAPFRDMARAAGYRAVLSVPLLSSREGMLGVLSVHFPTAHEVSERALGWLYLYARHAASFIERCQTDQVLRQSEADLRQYRDELEQLVAKRTSEHRSEPPSQQIRRQIAANSGRRAAPARSRTARQCRPNHRCAGDGSLGD